MMFLYFTATLGCALFEKQTQPLGENPVIDTGDITQDSDAITDSGSDTDSNAGTNTGSGNSNEDSGEDDSGSQSTGDPVLDLANSIDCDGEYSDVGAPDEQSCFTGFLDCGDVIASNTGGGNSTFFDSELYTDWYAMASNNSDYSSTERVYYFNHPGNGSVQVNLISPCENTDLWYFKTYDDDFGECPYETCGPCRNDNAHSGKNAALTDSVQMYDTSETASYIIVVESQSGDDAPFVLQVECP
ncbi:MAG: hypothetical protein VX278_11765 [Myxococcota bacterium]|nr:hypothetical protein [Myxococcota bacterium]